MALSSEEDKFLEAAVAAIPKVTGLIAAMPVDDHPGALDAAERRFLQTAEEFGCAELASREWTTAVMRILRQRVEEQESGKRKLKRLYEELSSEATDHAQLRNGETAERNSAASSNWGSKSLQAIRAFLKMAFQADDPGHR